MTTMSRYDWNHHDAMARKHAERCTNGCPMCQPDRFPKAAPTTFAMTDAAADLPRGGGRPQPIAINPQLAEARAFIASYSGTWEFMLTLQREFRAEKLRFTDRVIEVILNCKQRDEARAAGRQTAAGEAPVKTFSAAMRRHFAVENDEGVLVFLRVTKTERGWTYVDQTVGGQGDLPRAKVSPEGRYMGAMKSSFEKAMANPEAAMIRYGLEIGRCGHCNRTLTDASSRAAGIGPVCISKAGF